MKVNIKSDCRGWDVRDVVEQIFEDRGIDDPEHFLNPTEDDMLPLEDLKNIKEASDLVLLNVSFGRKIGLLSDVDLDGITSAAIIYRYLTELGADVEVFINQGKAHGLQAFDLEKYKKCQLFIIVDSLDSGIENYRDVLTDSEITDILVLDHHAIDPDIPYDDYITLVSSQRDYGNPQLSGAGVCMKFVLYLDKVQGTDYAENLWDLSASGIIGDMMDVTVPENRYICSRGLEGINNLAIKKIAGGFGWDSKAVAFSLAPVVNASNRLNKNEYALDAFLTDDNKSVLADIRVLKKCKEQQNVEVDSLMDDIEKQISTQLDKKMLVVFIDTEFGIGGLIGNKALERYKRPILILKRNENGICSGSMRAGVDDFRQMIIDSGLAKASGHELASGVLIKEENIPLLVDYMQEHLPDIGTFEETIDADIWINAEDVDRYFIDEIQRLNRISGTGFSSIRAYIDGITDYHVTDMSNGKHLVIELGNSTLKLIQWNFKGDWEVFEDAEMLCDELECVVELQSGFLGKNFWLQGIVQWIGVKNE